jgi:ATP synthase F0 subunit b
LAEYIAEIVGFVIIVAVVVKWGVPPIRKMTSAQQDAIRVQLEEAEQARKRLAAARDEYDQMLEEAAREAEKMQADARAQGEAIVSEMRQQAQEDARRIVEQGRQQIEADRQLAVVRLQSRVGLLSTALAERIVRSSMSDESRQRRVIDRFIDELDGMANVAAAVQEDRVDQR